MNCVGVSPALAEIDATSAAIAITDLNIIRAFSAV